MTLDKTNCLAMLANLGLASKDEVNELMEATVAKARTVARTALTRRRIRPDDFDDLIQEATIRAWKRIPQWEYERASWLTYAGLIADTMVRSYLRRYAREPHCIPLEEYYDGL